MILTYVNAFLYNVFKIKEQNKANRNTNAYKYRNIASSDTYSQLVIFGEKIMTIPLT